MKSFVTSTLVLLLVLQATATATKWVEVNQYTNSLATSLGFMGANFIIQQALFEDPTSPVPFAQYSTDSFEKIEQRVTDSHTYYRYQATIAQWGGDNGLKATFGVSYRHSDSNFVVICPHYTATKVLYNQYGGGTMIDLRGLNDGTSEFSSFLNESFKASVAKLIKSGELSDSKYSLRYVYNAYYTWGSFTFYAKIRDSKGQNYLMYMFIEVDYEQNITDTSASVGFYGWL